MSAIQGHTDDITALAVHPEGQIIATGEVGHNPAIIVWDSSNATEISQFKQGDDSRAVTTLAFSSDGSLLASCALDNNHSVRVWDWAKGEQLFENRGGVDKILDCAWSPSEHTFVTAGIKHVAFWSETEENKYSNKRGIFGKAGKQSNMSCAQYLPTGQALTGGSNGDLYVWDGNACSRSTSPHSADAGIHTLRVADSCILSGASDNTLVMLNFELEEVSRFTLDSFPRSCDFFEGKIVAGCRNGSIYIIEGETVTPIMSSHFDGEVWGLAVSSEKAEIFATVGDDNQLKVWNTSEHRCINSIVLEETSGKMNKPGQGASTLAKTPPNQQARCVAISPSNGHVAIGFNNGKVMVKAGIEALDQELAKFKNAKEWIETMRYSPNGKFLAVGSHDNGIYIYSTDDYSLKSSNHMMHSSFIVALDWSVDSSALHSCCGAHELLFWTVSEEGELAHNPNGAEELRDEHWDRFSTHFGWPVQGIFGHLKDYSHVNRVDRSQDGNTFAIGNDWGLVEVIRNPNDMRCYSKGNKAHSSHVTNVKWTYDSAFLLSAGGYDQCIMQWKIA